MKKPILEIKNLTKYYGKILGVEDLSLELYEGEIFGFIGPNGAGKSTTIRSIMNLINKNCCDDFTFFFQKNYPLNRFENSLCKSRLTSLSLIVARLSYCFLPLHTPRETLTSPFFK